MKIETLDRVDKNNNIIGQVSRDEAHGNPEIIHRVVHILVFNSSGELFLQKRGLFKDVQPGKWDTSVGGHIEAGESIMDGAKREMAEELGIENAPLRELYQYLHSNDYESELVTSFDTIWDGPIKLQTDEIDDGRFWRLMDIESESSIQTFTPNFLDELSRYRSYHETRGKSGHFKTSDPNSDDRIIVR